jgi:phosphotransferase system HPr (HPr) family protein
LRAAKRVVEAAARFKAAVSVCLNERRVNAKSMFDLLLIGAPLGASLTIEAFGDDAEAALAVVADVLGAPSADDNAGPNGVPAMGL